MITANQLIAAIDKLSAVDTSEMSSQQRINAANRICEMIVTFGPSWTEFTTNWVENNMPMRTLSAEQFSAFLAAKRAFAVSQQA